MGDRINIATLRERLTEAWAAPQLSRAEALALVEAVEAAQAFGEKFGGNYSCGCCPGITSFLVQPDECDCGCHEAARQAITLHETLERFDFGEVRGG